MLQFEYYFTIKTNFRSIEGIFKMVWRVQKFPRFFDGVRQGLHKPPTVVHHPVPRKRQPITVSIIITSILFFEAEISGGGNRKVLNIYLYEFYPDRSARLGVRKPHFVVPESILLPSRYNPISSMPREYKSSEFFFTNSEWEVLIYRKCECAIHYSYIKAHLTSTIHRVPAKQAQHIQGTVQQQDYIADPPNTSNQPRQIEEPIPRITVYQDV